MPYFGLTLAMEVLLIIHVIKTGRSYFWIYIVLFVPIAGAVAYILVEALPDLVQTPTGKRVAKDLGTAVNPDKHLRQLTKEAVRTDTVENRFRLAKECLERGRPEEARDLLEGCLTGIHAEDPAILLALAKARFGLRDFAGTVEALDRLRAADPNFQSTEGHLLYARSLEGLGETDRAVFEFEALAGYFPGEEARCRYGLLLEQAGRRDEAREVFADIVRAVDLGDKAYYRAQKKWYQTAKQQLGI